MNRSLVAAPSACTTAPAIWPRASTGLITLPMSITVMARRISISPVAVSRMSATPWQPKVHSAAWSPWPVTGSQLVRDGM